MREIVMLPHAVRESAVAFQWYESQSAGLGEVFLSRIDECLAFIQRNPEWHAVVDEDYRRALVKKFPFAIFYKFDQHQVVVYSVFHCAQDPQKWRDALP